MEAIEFFVPGKPMPGGSKKAFVNKKTGRANVVDASGQRGKDWRADVKQFAATAYQGPLLGDALIVTMEFVIPRPMSHWGTGQNARILKPLAPRKPTTKPDVLKTARSVEDALTGVIWHDDCQTVRLVLDKRYVETPDERPGVFVRVEAA